MSSKKEQPLELALLPTEVILSIMENMSLNDLQNFCDSNKRLKNICKNHPDLLFKKLKKEIPHLFKDQTYNPREDYYKFLNNRYVYNILHKELPYWFPQYDDEIDYLDKVKNHRLFTAKMNDEVKTFKYDWSKFHPLYSDKPVTVFYSKKLYLEPWGGSQFYYNPKTKKMGSVFHQTNVYPSYHLVSLEEGNPGTGYENLGSLRNWVDWFREKGYYPTFERNPYTGEWIYPLDYAASGRKKEDRFEQFSYI